MTSSMSDLIRALREKTGAGMMDCKNALVECHNVFDDAVDWLRKKGLAAAAKKAARVAADGLVGVAVSADGRSAAIVEVNSETDFVARNEKFQQFASRVAELAVKHGCADVAALKAVEMDGETVEAALTHLIAIIGENITLRRVQHVSVETGAVASYVHSSIAPGLGKIGVVVVLKSAAPADKLTEFGKKLAMHIAAANPQYAHRADVPAEVIEHEKQIFLEQIKDLGRPQNVVEKMVEGRVHKFYEETVLDEQVYIMDGKKKISEVLASMAKEFGSEIAVAEFVKYVLGEGIEKATADFAEEVQSMRS